jgi:large subunit ribosomal protein L15
LDVLSENFKDGDKITARILVKKGLVKTAKKGVKILGGGVINKKLSFSRITISEPAREKILKAGGTVE